MIWIEIIPPVDVVDLNDEPILKAGTNEQVTITMFEFLRGRLSDQKWGQDWAWGEAQGEIKASLKDAQKTDAMHMALERTDYEKLKDVVEKPHVGTAYNAAIMHNLVPFRKSILHPIEKKPEEDNDAFATRMRMKRREAEAAKEEAAADST